MRAAFGAKDAEPVRVDGRLWRCDDIGFRPATSPAETAWIGQTLGDLEVPDLRIGRPLSSSDGRWAVGGWSAFKFLDGEIEPHYDEVIAASLRLHKATADLERPRFLAERKDVFAKADKAAWDDEVPNLDDKLGGKLFGVLAGSRQPVKLKSQVVHGDLFGNVLFVDHAQPGIIDFTAYWRPAEWAAAVVAVDAIAWGGGDSGLLQRWSHLAEWPQSLLRALLFRLAAHAMHPQSTEDSLRGLEHASHEITALL